MRVKTRIVALLVLAACATLAASALTPAGAVVRTGRSVAATGRMSAASSGDLGFDTPDSWASRTLPGAPTEAAGFDPINVVIEFGETQQSAVQANVAILSALRKEDGVFWNEVGIGTNSLKDTCISEQDASVQPGSKAAARQDFSWRTVTCLSPELILPTAVTNHARVYIQKATGAWFLAVSEEHACIIKNGESHKGWHCITETGYNSGRDELIAELEKLPGYDVSVKYVQEYTAGEVPEHPLGYHTPYDGQVAVVTITKPLLPYQSEGWKYQQVAPGADSGFQDPGYGVSDWPTGQAGFGTTGGTCPWNNSTDVHTPWDANTDMLVRHSLTIPADATSIHIAGTIDNDATVYINGIQVQYVQSGNCAAGAIDVTVPAKDLKPTSLLAIRGHDYGDATYLDVTVTYNTG
jgi:hypothetical protein